MDTATNIFGVGHMTQIDGQYGCTGMSHQITLEGVHFFVTMMKTVSSMSISKAIAILENSATLIYPLLYIFFIYMWPGGRGYCKDSS